MFWLKLALALLGLFLLWWGIKAVRAFLRFKRHFEDFSEEAGQRLLDHAKQVDSTLERWHEYDEAYQEAVARLDEEEQTREQLHRGATLGPTGGSLRKPN
ncbi:MAG: hypothetical protein ACE5HB_06045 [Terriglobia bacterium]